MTILVNVVNQELRLQTPFKSLINRTQNFIKFKFLLDNDWDDLMTFAQFIQNGTAYNVYLDDENCVYLPPEITDGNVNILLYGTNIKTDNGGTERAVIGTTNYLTIKVEDSILMDGEISEDLTPDLYTKLVNMIKNIDSGHLMDEINLRARLSDLNAEVQRAKGVENDLSVAIDSKANQSTVTAIDERLQVVERGEQYDATISAAVASEITRLLNDGALANLTVEDNSITREKLVSSIQTALDKADNAWTKSTSGDPTNPSEGSWEATYDPTGKKVDPYAYAQTLVSTSARDLSDGIANSKTATKNELLNTDTITVTNKKTTPWETTDYTGLINALNGVMGIAQTYTDTKLADYAPFNLEFVETIDFTLIGKDRTFYLVPKASGDGYEKWWYVVDGEHNGHWDKFGSSTTRVVSELPSAADADSEADYILANDGDYQYYKYIDGRWRLIAGSNSETVTRTYVISKYGNGAPSLDADSDSTYYLDTDLLNAYVGNRVDGNTTWELVETLIANPSITKDYYCQFGSGNPYLHFRFNGVNFIQVGSDAYSKEEVDAKVATINNDITENANRIASNTQNISSANRAIDKVAQDLANLDVEGVTYYAALSTEDNKTYTYTLYEVDGDEETVKSQFNLPATGGGGGSSSTTTLVVDRITPSPVICTPTDRVILEVDFSSTDSDGETVDGSFTIRLGSSNVLSGNMVQGRNSFDVTEYCNVGTQKFTLTVTDEGGSVNVKTWTVQVADVRLETAFNDRYTYPVNSSVNFTYTPYGSVPKTVHFKLDGVELESVNTTASGTLQSYTLSPQTHGAHLLECWITATINNRNIETDHIFKDIIWYDETSSVPVIGCIYRYDHYGEVEAKQYNTTSIPYVVYDPRTTTPTVTLEVDGETYSTLRLSNAVNTWAYKSEEIAVHVLKIKCGDAVLEIHMNIVELGYDIESVTANLEFDFNPVGYSNSSTNRLWVDANHPNVKLSVSDNFDWSNGGYQLDTNGNQYFCVKAGTRATISYNLFAIDPKQSGAEFKLIFKTANVRDSETTFLSCLPVEDAAKVGLQMKAHTAYITTSTDSLFQPYSEEDIIEFEYNINTLDLEDSNATSYIMTYEDGVGSRALIYNDSHRIYQYQPVPITIGSDDCDVFIYRMKAYSSSLTDTNILANFVADSLDSDTMIARYERNQIYDENGNLTPDSVANACPNLKVIKIECPHFTNDKKDYVKYTNVECIHKKGDPILDNWKYTNGYHAGQGTTSNEYGYAGRNIDIIFGFDGKHQVVSKIPLDPNYVTELTLGDGTKYSDGSGKVTLTRTSVPNNWFNIKVNIASSENANNALLQKRYNDYLPYQTPAMRRNPFIKNSMEFYNCVIFIKENDPDISTHREFADTGWHFYGIGNLGDSKKTDNTRVNDPTDLKEFVVEISDNTLPNSWFQTGVYKDSNGNITYNQDDGVEVVYPITTEQWNNENNLKRKSLYEAWDDSYEFRYDMGTKDGETISDDEIDAQQERSKQVWRDMYEWVITSSDADFVAHLGDWFIAESPIYWYLFTERYTMIDNRAKNSFWHWGKTYITEAEAEEMGDDAQYYTVNNESAAINNGYRFDLWNYDDDTSLGINNTGELTMTYGHEDTDYKEEGNPASGYIFNAAENVFFRRIRKLMYSQLQAMYLSRESLNCWSANSLITEFDNWQNQFPEELWKLDIERKYLRTYKGGTERFLKSMMNGRKRYQRRQFERDQEAYIGTKYVGTTVRADQIMFRCNTPQTGVVVPPDYTLRIVPYSDMYLTVLYGNSPSPMQIRAKAGREYEITTTLTEMDDTAILIYCASRIQALNDLSACYIHDNDFSKASKLKTLIIGNTTEGYQNTFLTTLNMGNNVLLETLDIRNCPNLTGSINLSACSNLENFYAEGTSISSTTFARNGKVKLAHFPSTVSTLSFLNLNYLTDLVVADYSNLETLICEYSNIDALGILNIAADTLQTVRILGVDWGLAETTILNKCLAMNSSLFSGTVYISGTIRNQEIIAYKEAWTDLTVNYDPSNLVTQFKVTYVNADENSSVLYTTYVDQGELPPDPYELGLIDLPTLEPSEQYTYSFGTFEDGEYVSGSGWTGLDSVILADRTIVAKYTSTTRTYTVRFWTRVGVPFESHTNVAYGAEVVPSGIPTRTDGEANFQFYVFIQWDKSTGFIRSDLDVFAIWQSASSLPAVGTPMNEMSVAQIYAIGRAKQQSAYWEDLDYFEFDMGQDFNFSNVESIEYSKNSQTVMTGIPRDEYVSGGYYFDGSTGYTTDVVLFGEDSPSFTMAIDFQFSANTANRELVSMYENGSSVGFSLFHNGTSPSIRWGGNTVAVGYKQHRDIVVIRHQKDSNYISIYAAGGLNQDKFGDVVEVTRLGRDTSIVSSEPVSFGGKHSGNGYESCANGVIHWCKIWLDDLGDANAKKLASWSHERLRAEYWGADKYYITGSGGKTTGASFIFNQIIGGIKGRGYWMNTTSTNVGGWDASKMREFLNGRFFDGMPQVLQSIIQTVNINATAGNKSLNIVESHDKIYLPSLREMNGSNADGYTSEVGTSDDPISWFTGDIMRFKFQGVIRDYDEIDYDSNTEPSTDPDNSVKAGDIWKKGSDRYIFVPQDYLDKYGITANVDADHNFADGGWIASRYWWGRSPYLGYSSNFFNVNANGNAGSGYSASNVLGVCPGFSI